ncbi:MAG: Fe-S cluster assembly protein SufD [Dysgonamonadaceae bacterium]|jgi:Fe-S cluster assembly protein SufD|nr:Fe-S cluster assembly protein SufD [Dysgonamonadaceae bacterium]
MKQYIHFFQTNRQKIDQSCAPLLNASRDAALSRWEEQGFPPCLSEDYRHTDIARLLAPDFGFYLDYPGPAINPHRVFHCNVPNLGSHKHFVVNGHCYEEPHPDLPAGVFSGSLNRFAEKYPERFTRYYHRLAEAQGDGLAAFNTMFVQDGYVLYVPENTMLETPLQLTQISNGTIDSLTNRRLLVILEAGAQAQLLVCDHTTDENPVFAATQITEIYAGENAVFDLCELEESSPKTIRLANCFVRQAAASQVSVNSITLCNGVTHNRYRIDLTGEQAETQLYGMAISDARQHIDNFSLIHHQAAHCRSNELFKYILEEEAVGAFNGKIIVAPNAQKTEAYQTNRNLLGSRTCRMYSQPQLEIYADDVKCSHGMTTGRLDETALFYMRSRGIPEEEAILLLKFAFTNDVLQGIRMEGLRDRLKLLIDKRFRGELIKCQGCI